MTSRRSVGAVTVFGLAIMIMTSACTHRFPTVPKEQIPQAVLDLTNGFAPKGVTQDDLNIVWRVCAPKDGRLLVGFSWNGAGDKNKPTLSIASFPINESGEVAPYDGHSVNVEFSTRVSSQGGISKGTAQARDGSTYVKLDAGGVCLDPKLAKIVGTTSGGKSAETTPTNGFWFLSVNKTGILETWSKIVGLDSGGKVIRNFQGIME